MFVLFFVVKKIVTSKGLLSACQKTSWFFEASLRQAAPYTTRGKDGYCSSYTVTYAQRRNNDTFCTKVRQGQKLAGFGNVFFVLSDHVLSLEHEETDGIDRNLVS